MTYRAFFQTAFGHEHDPYAWQSALAEASDWPDALIAPTGLGKTAGVVLGWAWRHAQGDPAAPRRLVYCLPMRALVEQTAGATQGWMTNLAAFPGLPRCEDVHVLMGGADEPPWYRDPDRPAILIGTQDMLVSRALMRGYAMSRFRWPVDFALLHTDALWVFDEVQAMGAARPTSTQLEAFRRSMGSARPARSLWVSATLKKEWLASVDFQTTPTVWRVPEDFPEDAAGDRVQAIVSARKPVTRVEAPPPSQKKDEAKAYAQALAQTVQDQHRSGHPTLVIVNTVARAQAVHAVLSAASGSETLLIHSRFRPAERAAKAKALPAPGAPRDVIIVATQAIEAGVDLSAAVMVTELAPWASLVQRFGRVNRRGEYSADGGAPLVWIDVLDGADDKDAPSRAAPYDVKDLEEARDRLHELSDAAPSALGGPGDPTPVRRVLRRKDLIELFDTDPDLTGFDVDISPYVRDADDTDVRVFWREDAANTLETQPAPTRDELCAIPIGRARTWLKGKTAYHADPQARPGKDGGDRVPTWRPLSSDGPWPGLVLMLDVSVGGYTPDGGFNPDSRAPVAPVPHDPDSAAETADADPDSSKDVPVPLTAHLGHVAKEAEALCDTLGVTGADRDAVVTTARWHDVGKAHAAFQARLGNAEPGAAPLAKAAAYHRDRGRAYFRHELASALAFLAHHGWAREADLAAYLIAAHHGKVRLSLRALPKEQPAPDGRRFARGVWESDPLPAVDLDNGTASPERTLVLSVMDLGWDDETGASWTERTRALLDRYGPFRLAWLEALVRLADWRASEAEQKGGTND
ncbi:type I-G CRISPR-associated helicase/endonuclease Cas3g [Roseospira goensis]|uniref:CRISPR-associated endonuclease/helicase Cas3 n=1 Tax=Roseospira goensis TaxID=391922 RepID=A0A7W6S0Q9_9PROT|nr:CRISPR-associated helicase Cas3' [Roseospira goensis]MBB4286760.1 CRISPR-associated endonuclease/helicase Cas3 [Roseospira goensis]